MQSVADYGGFYIAEAELGYTSTGAITNKARGMNLTADGHTFVNDGNYYRGTELKDIRDIFNDIQIAKIVQLLLEPNMKEHLKTKY